jgi:hypothetical protein
LAATFLPNKKTQMTMTHHLLEHALHWLCLLAALTVGACGPGTGGTGTGPQPITAFAASYTSAPSAGTGSSAAMPSTGTGSATSAVIRLQLQTTGIVLTSACAGFDYAGSWSVSPLGDISVQGIYASTSSVNSVQQAAVLSIAFTQTTGDSGSLSLRITTPQGTLLLGPLSLQRTDTAAALTRENEC